MNIRKVLDILAIPGFLEMIIGGMLFLVYYSCVASIVKRKNLVSETAKEIASTSFGSMWGEEVG